VASAVSIGRWGGRNAGQERADHTAIAADATSAPRRCERPGDWAHAGSGAEHDPRQPQTSGRIGPNLASASELSDDELEQRLFAHTAIKPGQRRHLEPDWAALARELKRPDVNLMVLWEEYRQAHPEAYGYSRFVAAKFMLRLAGRARDTTGFPGPSHNIERGDLGSTRLSETPSMVAASVAEADLSAR
jgi:hypothetical protein